MWRLDEAAGSSLEVRSRELAAALRTMDGAIEGLQRLQVGVNAGRAAGNADVVMIAWFADMEAFERYDQHPAHLDVARWISGQSGLNRMAVDFVDEELGQ
jgi:hypothetical protein